MSAFVARVAALTGVPEARLVRLAGGDLSQVLLVERADGKRLVAKGGPSVATESVMLRMLRQADAPVPAVEADYGDVLLIEHVDNDGVFNRRAWADVGVRLRMLHERSGAHYGWPVDYALGTVLLDNKEREDWPGFWAEQRLLSTASLIDRPLRDRVASVAARLGDMLPASPPAALLHGDLWSGNILVRDGALAALIDPACYHGDPEVDLAMLTLFDAPSDDFWAAYGPLEAGWAERRPIYQLFPALAHLRLFGSGYAGLVDGLLAACGA